MPSLQSRYLAAKTFDEFLAGGPKHTELYRVLRSRATSPSLKWSSRRPSVSLSMAAMS
jgi:hypothetical protein